VLAAVAVAPAPGTASAASRSACQRLTGHDLAPARSVKLVRRTRGGMAELVSCSLPRGRVLTLASGTIGSMFAQEVRVRQVTGAFAALTTTFSDQYASGSLTAVVDLRTGRARTIASAQQETGLPTPAGATEAVAVAVTAGGRGAAAVTVVAEGGGADGGGGAVGAVRILAFGARGAPAVLDTGAPADLPPASLTLTGATVGWTHGGAPRSAPLP
jgi:hypothetical protein